MADTPGRRGGRAPHDTIATDRTPTTTHTDDQRRHPLILAAAQRAVTPADPGARLAEMDAVCARAAAEGAALVALPEAFVPGYRWEPGSAERAARVRRAARAAAAEHGLCVALGLVDPVGSALLLAAPDGRTWTYHKRFIAVGEAAVWRPGRGDVVAAVGPAPGLGGGRVGMLVCADVLQPAAWRGLRGRTDLLVVAAAWPDYRGRETRGTRPLRPLAGALGRGSADHRDRVLAGLARHLGAPVVFANAVGPWRRDEGFTGGSAVIDGRGATVARAGAGEEAMIVGKALAGPGGPPPRQPVRWRLFNAANRMATTLHLGWSATRRAKALAVRAVLNHDPADGPGGALPGPEGNHR